jgi:predicted deacylase
MAGARVTERIDVSNALGTRHQLVFHKYGSKIASKKAYIQATLHADEIPGLLVNHHLLRMLDEAEKRGDIKESIVVVPYANPIGLSQELLGTHIGRFNLATGINFNREWPDLIDLVGSKVDGQLSVDDAVENVKTIRKAILAALDEASSNKEEIRMKQILYRESCDADIVLDLHCDSGKSHLQLFMTSSSC